MLKIQVYPTYFFFKLIFYLLLGILKIKFNIEVINKFNDEMDNQVTQELLLNYIKEKDPRMLKFDPKFVKVKDGRVHFGAKKHYGVLTFPVENLVK